MRMPRNRRALPCILVLIACLAWLSPASASILVIQPVVAGNFATPNIYNDQLFTEKVFTQASIDVQFLPTATRTDLPDDVFATEFPVPNAYPTFLTSTSYQAPPVLTVWYVRAITNAPPGARGVSYCWGGISGLCGVWISNVSANDTVPHEIAHILTNFQALWNVIPGDSAHSSDAMNLLASATVPRNIPVNLSDVNTSMYTPTSVYDRIDPIQAAAMTSSPFVQDEPVPEPISCVLVGSGLFLTLAVLRRKGVPPSHGVT